MKNTFLTIATLTASILSCSAQENLPKVQTPDKKNYSYKIIVDSLDIPWGMSFINENDLLVTEKSGILYRIRNGNKKRVKGLPPVYVRGQGGLLDIAVSPHYEETKEIFFTMSSEISLLWTFLKIHLASGCFGGTSLVCILEGLVCV